MLNWKKLQPQLKKTKKSWVQKYKNKLLNRHINVLNWKIVRLPRFRKINVTCPHSYVVLSNKFLGLSV